MTRFLLTTAFCVAATASSAFDLEAMTDAERDAFRAEVRAFLLEQPEVLMEAIAVLEQRQQQAAVQSDFQYVADNQEALFDDGFSFVGGNPDGDITIVEFLDYRCGFCKRAYDEVEELINSDGNIRFIVKEFPILGEQSTLASQFAIAVKEVYGAETYKAVHDALMVMRSDVNANSLTQLAESLGLDPAAIESAANSDEVTRQIGETHLLAQRMAITGTPTFIIGDQMLRGYVPLAQMQQIVAEKRKEG